MSKYKNLRVAVTDGSYKHTLGIVRKLGNLGVKPYVITDKKRSLAGLSKHCKKEIIIDENCRCDKLIEKLSGEKIELLILVGTNSFKKIVPWKEYLEKNGIKILTVDACKMSIALNKKDTYELAKEVGVPIPNTIYPKNINQLNEIKDKISFPCVIKGLHEMGENMVDYVYDKEDLTNRYKKLCAKYNLTEDKGLPMLQEYIPGAGCAFFALYNNGKCGPTFQHKRIREYPVTGGVSTCAESYKSEILEKYGRGMLDALNWHGVAMVEFKLSKNEQPVLMEINPKFWGSTDLALEAGVDFPKGLLEIYLNEEIKYSNSYKFPFRYHWPFDGDIQHVLERSESFPNFVKDIFNPKVRSNLRITDPMPTIFMIVSFAWVLLKKTRDKFHA